MTERSGKDDALSHVRIHADDLEQLRMTPPDGLNDVPMEDFGAALADALADRLRAMRTARERGATDEEIAEAAGIPVDHVREILEA
jgi:hypothetical protein